MALIVNGFRYAEQTVADITVTTNSAAVAPTAVNTLTSNIQAKRPTFIYLNILLSDYRCQLHNPLKMKDMR